MLMVKIEMQKFSLMKKRCSLFLFSMKSTACFMHLLIAFLSELQVAQLKELSKRPDIYEILTKSMAPNIWELDDVKKGLLCQVRHISSYAFIDCLMNFLRMLVYNWLQLFGGNALKLASGANFRGDINSLLVGDPGTSKSQLLQYIHKLSPRGIYTSGRGSSAVGLTAYVTKDPETGETVWTMNT